MCGIIFTVSDQEPLKLPSDTLNTLRARGPDSLIVQNEKIQANDGAPRFLTIAASVLSLRGSTVEKQPLSEPLTNSLFCWNGEAWKLGDAAVSGNDAVVIFQQLLAAVSKVGSRDSDLAVRSEAILGVLTRISGPFATLFFDAPTSTVYFARDRLGRRSLMMNRHRATLFERDDVDFVVSSFELISNTVASEVSTAGIYRLDLRSRNCGPELLPWRTAMPAINKTLPSVPSAISGCSSTQAINDLNHHLTSSVERRTVAIPTYNIATTASANPSRLAILFSGGLDCMLLARICHKILPNDQPIDLLNVAFENPRAMKAVQISGNFEDDKTSFYELCPDRITGRSTFDELVAVCPTRNWSFVAIDVPYTEMLKHRSTIIQLMRPHNTEMDLSIAMALYFAARGKGTIQSQPGASVVQYTTTARVLLSGLGADELFGGYSRHLAAFERGGFDVLNDELELDFTRIGSRNLGRDDRVIAHWSREVRYPYLDEEFVNFALGLPVWEKVGFRPKNHSRDGTIAIPAEHMNDLPPAKLILRCLASQLGMRKAATEKKRAIQFGARTAKMQGGRTKGTDLLHS